MAGTRSLSGEPPRSTAYYYADIERLKRKNAQESTQENVQNPELNEYVETNEVVNDGAVREVPPFRDRRQWSLPEYNTPENSRKIEETYSTAGTFPMPEPKEKEPLLAELEIVGRVPLTQLDTSAGVRRSRSWYLCCPNIGDEEISRESSWRYSSLRPVTAPPMPGHDGFSVLVGSQNSCPEDVSSLRAERDALARALAAERQRSAAAARAHDARLAELHGVIAELVRRRAHDKQSSAIPEEEVSDECESTTQAAAELEQDCENSPTEQNDTSSALSPAELPTPQESKVEPHDDNISDVSTHVARSECLSPEQQHQVDPSIGGHGGCEEDTTEVPEVEEGCDTSLNLSERDSEVPLSQDKWCEECCQSAASCEGETGSLHGALYRGCESRKTKLASRVRLRRAHDSDTNNAPRTDDDWCSSETDRVSREVCTHTAGLPSTAVIAGCGWRASCALLRAERRVLQCALARAAHTAHRLYSACAVHESSAVSLCCALRAADRALETYDVLLALCETGSDPGGTQREAAELVARQLLARLDGEVGGATIGEPLLSPGPWLQHHNNAPAPAWSEEGEARLRAHAARLKGETVALRGAQPPPKLFSYHDIEESELGVGGVAGGCSSAEMEAAVALLDALETTHRHTKSTSPSSARRRRTRPRHWLHPRASETPL